MRPDIPSDPTPRLHMLGARTVAATDEGRGPVVVALHGYPGSSRDYRWLAPVVSDRLRFIRVEMPGFGASPPGGEPQTPELHAEVLVELLDALALERPVLLAHSMGGAVALRVATDLPDRVAGLALLGSPGLTPHQHLRRIPVRPLARAFAAPWARVALAPAVRAGAKLSGFPRSLPPAAIYQAIDFAAAHDSDDHAARCRRVTQPCFMAYAADDGLVEPAIGDALGAALPAGPRLRFERGGHNVQKTQASAIGEALAEWVAALVAGAEGEPQAGARSAR